MPATPSGVTLWTNRKIAYSFDAGYPFADAVRKAMNQWEVGGVSFIPRTTEVNYVLITNNGTGSFSAVGMRGGQQTCNITADYKALHELGHTLGFIHEQCRSDRDDFVTMQWGSISGGTSNSNFAKQSSTNLTPYDRLSVMHYPAPATGWGGSPPNQEVWTMRWNADNNQKLGPSSWTSLSEQDIVGLRAAYASVPAIMGDETAHGSWNNAYATQFPFAVGGRQFFYGQNLSTNYWFIQELLSNGTMGAETANGHWKYAYKSQFSFTIGGKVFFYGQNMNGRNWFIQELLADGKMGSETDHGTWKFAYETQFPFTIGGRVFFYGQNMNEKNWFIQELLADGKMGSETDHGTWNFAYETQFPFTIGGKVFFYGQNMNERNWFIQELLADGKMGSETDHGTWHFAYKSQFTFTIGGKVYFYGQNMNEKNWFIQELLADGKMGVEYQHGHWNFAYAVQFPFQFGTDSHYFYGQNLNEKNWFIQRLNSS